MKKYKEFYPIIITLVLFLVALFIFFVIRYPNINLWIPISLYVLIEIGFIVSLILSFKCKNINVKIFSMILNFIFMIPLSIWIYLLLLANGISES